MKWSAAILGSGLAMLACGAQAADSDVNDAIVRANNTYYLGAGLLHQDYYEYDDSNAVPTDWLDKEKGSIGALGLDVSNTSGNFVYGGQLRYAQGDTAYDGYLQNLSNNTVTPSTTTTGNRIFTARGNYGYMIPLASNAALTPGVELAYRYWYRDVGKGGLGGIKETYSDLRLGAALAAQMAFTPRLVGSLRGAAGYMLAADINVENIGYGESLGKRPYYRVGLGLDYRLGERLHLRGDADYEQFSYDASQPHYYQSGNQIISVREPRSRTYQSTFMLGVGYEF